MKRIRDSKMTGTKVITVLLLCFIIALLIPPVSAAACSFCEFINISKGDAANITVNATFTGAGGTAATVTNIGTTTDAIFDFLIPMGLTGLTGPAGADNMTAGPAGPAGTANMTAGPAGAAATIAVNATFTGAVGTNADVVNVGSASAASLDFTIPQGMMNQTINQTANMTASNLNTTEFYFINTSRALTGMSVKRNVNNDVLSITGGTGGLPYSGNLQLYGGDNVAMSGGVIMAVGNASGDASEVVFSIAGRTDTPTLDLSNNKITSLADPTLAQDAVTKKYADDNTTATNNSMKAYVDLAILGVGSGDTTGFYFLNGTRVLTGKMNAAGFNITNLSSPIGTLDAATKGYVDGYVNTSYVLLSNASYVLTNNGSYVQVNNGSYVQITNGSYVKIDNTSYYLTDGSRLLTGKLDAGGFNLTNVSDPIGAQDALTLNYLNTHASTLMNQTPNQTPGTPGEPGGTGGVILYFNHSASDIATYEGLVKVPAGNAEADETVTVKDDLGFVIVDSYATILGEPGLAQLPAGLWQFRSWNYADSASGTTAIDFKVYNRTAGGTETFLFNVTSSDIDASVATLYTTTYVQAAPYTISLTDRIVIKVYGHTTRNVNTAFHFVYDDSLHTSNVQTPLAVADPTTLTFGAQAAEALKKGQAVYISGAVGENPTISRANNTVSSQCRVVGLVTTDLASGAIGLVRRGGILTAVDTQATNTYVNPNGETWLAGDLLWSTGTGGMSKVRPTSGRSVKAAFSMLGSDAADVLLAYPFENPVWSTAAAGENIVLRAGDSAGANKTSFRNYTNSEVAYVDSLGNAMFNGTTFTGNLTMSSKYITGLLTGSSGGSVPNKSYVDSAIAGVSASDTTGFYFLNGTRVLTGKMDAAGFNLTNLSTPIGTLDAVTKAYADAGFVSTLSTADIHISANKSVLEGEIATNQTATLSTADIHISGNKSVLEGEIATNISAVWNNGTFVKVSNTSYTKNPFYSYITLMAGSAMVPTTNPATLGQNETPTGKNNYIMGNFTDGGSENLQWIVDMPADWDSTAATNGKLNFTFLWTAQEGSGVVNWTINGTAFPDDAALGTVMPEIGYTTDTLITAGDMHISPDTAAALVTSAGTGGNTVIFRAARNTGSAADTFTGTAQLIGVRVKYIQTKVAA